MEITATNSLLHLDLLKLRQFNDIGVTKYKKTYPDNEVYRIFVKTHSVGKDRIIPLYFDFTDMMIRKCQKELEILECQFNSEHFKSAIIEYLNFDYKFNDWYSIECADLDKYKVFYKTLEDLSGVLLPTLKLMPSDDFKVIIPDNTLYSFHLNTKDVSQTVEPVSILEGFYFINKVFKVEEFTAYNVLETLFKTNNFSLNIKPGYAGLITLETFSDPSSRIRIKTLEMRRYGESNVRDNTLKPFITLVNKRSYNNEIVINYESEYGSKIKEVIIGWLLEISDKLKGTDSREVYALFENLNTFLIKLSYIDDPESDYFESMVNFISDVNNVSKLFVAEEDKYRYNIGGFERGIPVNVLKGKLINMGKSGDIIEIIPGRYQTDKRTLHGFIFIDSNHRYGFFDYAKGVVITDIFESSFKDVENKEEVMDKIFTAIRRLNVKEYWFTLLDTENEKGLWVCDKFKFGIANQVNMDDTELKLKRALVAVVFRKPSEENEYSTAPMLLFKDLTPESLETYIASRLAEV